MWIRTHTKLYTGIDREKIWNVWADIDNWPKWHSDLEYCKLEGAFKAGSHFILKPKGMRAVKIRLTDVVEGVRFTDCTQFIGAKMCDTHAMEETVDGLLLSNTIVVTGPLQWIWIKLVAQHVADTVVDEMDALVELARGIHA